MTIASRRSPAASDRSMTSVSVMASGSSRGRCSSQAWKEGMGMEYPGFPASVRLREPPFSCLSSLLVPASGIRRGMADVPYRLERPGVVPIFLWLP